MSERSTLGPIEKSRARRLWQNLQSRRNAFPHYNFGLESWDVLLACCLSEIESHPISVGEISRQLGVPQTTMIRRVDELEAGKLVERRPHPSDKRKTLLYMTSGGIKQMRNYLRSLQ